ncbi:MAG TPA: aminoacyl-tRNA hydrolase [Candidatus Portnoybacteria bacterium]|jgi:peptidyl-tRNA hydrolase, PTH1 family|nr:aminoacyl-tRNA hydrolase [Candidatus Portnoybacteria bacterium]MDD5751978.1 aminoacyl-tRNA hydrolase [Candidatus Portnoybacteria bacterium]HNU96638.1 aminoacyl-tRNA hydrolase [Candidatus Portnoybacteria bacterium]HOZ16218.1 aminoacyl-tRNA hydrolase [Candidatus Portnoybacteria bacterium]HPH51987.1 aminoacyl-tRNA hydrolase [Candidatus Portnoybacteria bacterium]
MHLIVGLGNPEKKYEKTRHNIGFRAVDEIAANFQFPIFNFQSIFNAQISKGKILNKDIVIIKPQAMMNNSGLVIKKFIRNSKFKIQNLIVIHDDIDLLFGDIRISTNSSSAGHKGVQSIIDELKTQDFTRIRIGIKPELKVQNQKLKVNTTDFVLKNFTSDEEKKIPEIIKKAVEIIPVPLS